MSQGGVSGWPRMGIANLSGKGRMDILGLRLKESCAGRQGLLVMAGYQLWLLILLFLTASAMNKNVTRS